MPRTNVHHSSQVPRARNRINNKSRLRVVFGVTIDGEVLGEESTQNQSYGVDAEDSTEHHLQAVLSANWQRNTNTNQRATRGLGSEKEPEAPAAYIPTPDSTGVVADHEELYPRNSWHDPETYIKSSDGVDESVSAGLKESFTYLMDERDEDWLEKNNEEARGEGTSAQGAVSSTPGARISRSAKSKGKEPDISPPFAITHDEFELVMGLYDLFTNDKTPFLHHSLEHDSTLFPPYSDYQELFANPLSPENFAAYSVPSWVPVPAHMQRLARTIYPYWRERRIDRSGHRVIPCLNFDEADVANESYICFRRREIKAIRKTRASQASSSDKLLRLQAELIAAQALVDSVIQRENNKKLAYTEAYNLAEKRLELIELKAMQPSLSVRDDEDLLIDKERPPKRSRTDSSINRIKLRPGRETTPSLMEAAIRPRERLQLVNSAIEREITRQTERDHHWDDRIELAYQTPTLAYSRRLFKYLTPPKSPSSDLESPNEESSRTEAPRALRIRAGRGGRILVDRRQEPPAIFAKALAFQFPAVGITPSATFPPALTDDSAEQDRLERLAERWKFDSDDMPDSYPDGFEEADRILIDDYEPKYMRYSTTLLQESDHAQLQTDNTLFVPGSDGKPEMVHPYRLGPVPMPVNRRPVTSVSQNISNGLSQGLKRMPPPSMVQSRVPSNVSIQRSLGVQPTLSQPLVPSQVTTAATQSIPSVDVKTHVAPANQTNGHAQVSSPRINQNHPHSASIANGQYPTVVNGYPPAQPNGTNYLQLPNGQSVAYNAMTLQQIQDLKIAYANSQQIQSNVLGGVPSYNNGMYGQNVQQQQHFNNVGQAMKLSLPPQRAQWQALTQQMQQNTQLTAATPMRTPSANGKRISRPPSANLMGSDPQAQITSYLQQHGSPVLPIGIHQNAHLSPPRTTPPTTQSPRLSQPAVSGQ